MFCNRRHSLLHLILALLGFCSLKVSKLTPDEREAHKAKGRLFRSRLKDAFSVWDEEKQDA